MRFLNNGKGGIDTSDATATIDDILEDKTAYVKGKKIEGNIKTIMDTVSEGITYTTIDNDNNADIVLSISDTHKIALTTTISDKILNIYQFNDGELGKLLHTINSSDLEEADLYFTAASICEQHIMSSDDIISIWAVLNKHKVSDGNQSNNLVKIIVINYNLQENNINYSVPIQLFTGGDSSSDRNTYLTSAAIHPIKNQICAFTYQVSLTLHIEIFEYNTEKNIISNVVNQLQGGDFYGGHSFWISWNKDGSAIQIMGKNNNNNWGQCYLIGTFDSNTYSLTIKLSKSNYNECPMYVLYKDYYIDSDGTIYDFNKLEISTNHTDIVRTKADDAWIYEDYYFIYSDSNHMIYVYKINEDFSYELVNQVSFERNLTYNGDYPGSIYYPLSNTYLYLKNKGSILKFTLLNNTKVLKALTRNNIIFSDNSDSFALPENVKFGEIYYNYLGKQMGTMPDNGELSYEPSEGEQTIPLGYTSGGKVLPMDITKSQEYKECLEISNSILS